MTGVMEDISAVKAFWYQDRHRLSKQVGAVVSEQALGLAIDEDDVAMSAGNDDGVGNQLKDRLEIALIAAFMATRVFGGGSSERSPRRALRGGLLTGLSSMGITMRHTLPLHRMIWSDMAFSLCYRRGRLLSAGSPIPLPHGFYQPPYVLNAV